MCATVFWNDWRNSGVQSLSKLPVSAALSELLRLCRAQGHILRGMYAAADRTARPRVYGGDTEIS